jgi:hypothetical protein
MLVSTVSSAAYLLVYNMIFLPRHVYEKGLYIDAHVFTCLIEDVVACMLIQTRKSIACGFHELFIPRSWFVRSFARTWDGLVDYGFHHLRKELTNVIAGLAFDLHVGKPVELGTVLSSRYIDLSDTA